MHGSATVSEGKDKAISDSTIGGGENTAILSPGIAQKQPLSGIGQDPLHGRQACPEVNSQNEDKFITSLPLLIVERLPCGVLL